MKNFVGYHITQLFIVYNIPGTIHKKHKRSDINRYGRSVGLDRYHTYDLDPTNHTIYYNEHIIKIYAICLLCIIKTTKI